MIRGELTNLRAVERSDSGLLHRWFNDPEGMRYWGITEPTVSHDEVIRRIEFWIGDESAYDRPACFVIELLDSTPVGVIILGRLEPVHASAELSMLIAEAADRGKGYGTDALNSIARASFEQWRLHRLWLRVEAFNEQALAFYERFGFVREGVFRESSYFDGEFHDQFVFGLLETDLVRDEGRPRDE